MASWLENTKAIGNTLSGFLSGKGFKFATPAGQNAIPSSVLTKAQKTFSTDAANPNLPKPKTLFFVHFNLNPDLENKIKYKQQLIEELSGEKVDGTDINAMAISNGIGKKVNDMKDDALKSVGLNPKIANFNKNKDKKLNTTPLKDSTIVDYIPTKDVLKKLSFEMSKLVKNYNKPGVTFGTTELNEYNRKRLVYKNVTYDDVTITFFDVKDNPVQQFFHAYLKFICGDFLCKNKTIWEMPIANNKYQNASGYTKVNGGAVAPTYLGNLNSFGFNIDSNFRLINSISFCEYYMDRLLVYTIENPVITKIKWGDGVTGDFSANDIQITFKYEGITNDLLGIEPYGVSNWKNNDTSYKRYMVNKEIKKEISTFLQTRYNSTTNNILSDVTSILKGYMNGETKFSWNTLKHQALDTARKYGMANEANTIAQAHRTIQNYKSQDGRGKAKYLVNMSTDPTSLIGRAVAAIKPNQSRGQFII